MLQAKGAIYAKNGGMFLELKVSKHVLEFKGEKGCGRTQGWEVCRGQTVRGLARYC